MTGVQTCALPIYEYILVAPDEEALGKYTSEQTKESRRLRAGDEVITAAADLYDGKVIR